MRLIKGIGIGGQVPFRGWVIQVSSQSKIGSKPTLKVKTVGLPRTDSLLKLVVVRLLVSGACMKSTGWGQAVL